MCVYVGEGLRRSLATPDPFVLTNKICLNQRADNSSSKIYATEIEPAPCTLTALRRYKIK